MKHKLKVAQFGLGPIGLECLRAAASQNWATIVGAVDIDPSKQGLDLAVLTGSARLRGLRVRTRVGELKQRPDLVFHTTVSRFEAAYAQLRPLIAQGINVVSSCEELLFPQLRQPKLAVELDRACRHSKARVVGTGVNPGFVMDLLPLCLTSVSHNVKAIHVRRVVNASTRREPLQRKIGSGLPPATFHRLFRAGKAGHAGLKESLALIAHSFGHQVSEIRESGKAVVAQQDIQTAYLKVSKGQTCGLHQRAQARLRGKFEISLDLKMYLDAPDPHDAISIVGEPSLDVLLQGGVAGDQATVAALVNTAPRLMRTEPGLRLITDLPLG